MSQKASLGVSRATMSGPDPQEERWLCCVPVCQRPSGCGQDMFSDC